jgi:hypothetical protein
MHLPTFLFFIIPLLTTTTYARCFPSNERKEAWNDKADAFRSVEYACRDLNKTFRMGDTRATCLQGDRGQKYDFRVTMNQDPTGAGEYVLSFEDCRERFRTNVDACERGGTTANRALTFTYVSHCMEKPLSGSMRIGKGLRLHLFFQSGAEPWEMFKLVG